MHKCIKHGMSSNIEPMYVYIAMGQVSKSRKKSCNTSMPRIRRDSSRRTSAMPEELWKKVRYKCSRDAVAAVAPGEVRWGPPWLASSRAICSHRREGKKKQCVSILNMSCFTWLEIRIYVKTCRLLDSLCFRWFWFPEWQAVKCFGRTWCIFCRCPGAILHASQLAFAVYLQKWSERSPRFLGPTWLTTDKWCDSGTDQRGQVSVGGVCSQAFQYFATEMLQGTNK